MKETITTRERTNTDKVAPAPREATGSQTIEYVVYFLFGILDIFLGFRLLLKLMGASTSSGFVNAVYGFTRGFILPFEGIFRTGRTGGIETAAVFEPATLIALIVYGAAAWGIVQLVRIVSGQRQESD